MSKTVQQKTDTPPRVAPPAGAHSTSEWMVDGDRHFRTIEGPNRQAGSSQIYAHALQRDNGGIDDGATRFLNGPAISIDFRCPGENFWRETGIRYTANEARQAAGYISEAADLIDRWSDPESHVCGFDWCQVNWRCPDEHWWLEYVPASLRSGDPHLLGPDDDHTPLKVGVGVIYDEGDLPAITVHVDGGPRDVDEDCHLKIVEAVMLRELLDRSISTAVDALRHMTRQMTASAEEVDT